MTTDAPAPTVGAVAAVMDIWYPPETAADWDRVGLVVGEPQADARRILLAVDCLPQTVDEAVAVGADLMIVHHPLLLRGVHSVATTTYKGALVHRLIRSGMALFVAHTNADSASPGVTDALATRLGLVDVRPMFALAHHPGRIGRLSEPMGLGEFVAEAARRLPATTGGLRAAGEERIVSTVALAGGAGDGFLADATAAGADVYLTADLRHHPASEHLAGGGPALVDAAHWATERPWLDALADRLTEHFAAGTAMDIIVSNLVTDAWSILATADRAAAVAHTGAAARHTVDADVVEKERAS